MRRIDGKRIGIWVVATSVGLMLTGCGTPFPKMSDEEYQKVVTYAAGILMKYQVGSSDKLTYVDPTYTPPGMEDIRGLPDEDTNAGSLSPIAGSSGADSLSSTAGSSNADTVSTTAGGANSGDTPLQSGTEVSPGGNGQQKDTGKTDQVELSRSYLQKIADGIEIKYDGYSIKDSYPDSGEQGAMVATEGKKLLVLNFKLTNPTSSELAVNAVSANLRYKLTVDGEDIGFTNVTMIQNDLSSLVVKIPAVDKMEAVLLHEVDAARAKKIGSISLQIIAKDGTQNISLE